MSEGDDTKRHLVELSHVVRHGMVTYPGLPGPEICDHMNREDSRDKYAPGTEFQIGRITMVANTGTYVDAPFHRFAEGQDLAELDLSRLVDVPGLCVGVTGGKGPGIGPDQLAGHNVTGRAVLIRTGWDVHWGTEGYGAPHHPFLSGEGARWLAEREPAVVGIDSVNIDDMADATRPAHTTLLAAGIPVVEHMAGLDRLPERGFSFHAAPVAVSGMGTFPVRAYALVDADNR
ncbi:cyclase family protein [Streptomyces europaeiscabiei]|uniref:cyclase family protein n=1 Tax=Streptomyces europaeiscabiei TaxID=146819 RepID=UPI0029B9088C|nr:cyclase family protein [Streptomyces europaeiscabiei]MDX2525281.1 cyclase family protein [Streptomyces europaeiscabiei]